MFSSAILSSQGMAFPTQPWSSQLLPSTVISQNNLPPEPLALLSNHHNPQWVSIDGVQSGQICSDLVWQ